MKLNTRQKCGHVVAFTCSDAVAGLVAVTAKPCSVNRDVCIEQNTIFEPTRSVRKGVPISAVPGKTEAADGT